MMSVLEAQPAALVWRYYNKPCWVLWMCCSHPSSPASHRHWCVAVWRAWSILMPHKKACPLQTEWKLFIISSQFLVAILECLPGREILIIFFSSLQISSKEGIFRKANYSFYISSPCPILLTICTSVRSRKQNLQKELKKWHIILHV